MQKFEVFKISHIREPGTVGLAVVINKTDRCDLLSLLNQALGSEFNFFIPVSLTVVTEEG